MAFITADRVLDSSTSTGTGAFVVSGTPAAGYRTFSAVMSVGDTCYYSIQGQTTSEWEVGLGTYSSANTLTRTTVYSSSNSGSAVTFSAGTKNVFITIVASKAPQLDPSGNVTTLGTPTSVTLTNATGLPLGTGVTGTLSANNGGSLAWQSVQSGNFTAVVGNAYFVNTTSGAITVTLPASPTAGQAVQLTDYAGTWGTNNVTVAPGSNKVNGASGNCVFIVSRSSVALVYADATQGWVAYSGFKATNLGQPYDVSYLVVAGGGGGGSLAGGGAGGDRASTLTLTFNTVYTITVGAGGAGNNAVGTSGSNSVFASITSTGGGGGGAFSNTQQNGLSGGSGGGGGTSATSPYNAGTVGAGTSGQGNSGGLATATGATAGGGGGGAGAVGGNASFNTGGVGGAGAASSITGSSVTYAGGGGGSGFGTLGAGGAGGGGSGARSGGPGATAGTTNTGGGGGGGYANSGASGGSGIVILSIPTVSYSGTYTNATVTTSGSNTILTFNASGTYTA